MNARVGTEPVDLVIYNIGCALTVDRGRRIIDDAALAVRDGKIVMLGKEQEVTSRLARVQVHDRFDAKGAIVTPGLIDCHLHSSFHLARGLADEANAREFLISRMYPYEAALRPEDVRLSARLAGREMIRHGTTCFVDPGNIYPYSTLEGLEPLGMRAVLAQSAFDLPGSDLGTIPAEMITTAGKAATEAESLISFCSGKSSGRTEASVSFRGLNNCSDELIRALLEVSNQYDVVLQTHACFSYSTHDSSVAKFGESEVERLHRLGALGPRTLLAHAGWLEPHELRLIRESGANITVNPSSSMHNGYGVIKMGLAPEMLADGVNIGLGTDHASSGAVDLVREMFLITCAYKEERLMARVLPPETALEMCTINAARALGRDNDIGSLEVGKQADLVLFDADAPELVPLHNPVSNVVYSASGANVSTVFVAGNCVLLDGRLTGTDEEELLQALRMRLPDFTDRLDLTPLTAARWPRQ